MRNSLVTNGHCRALAKLLRDFLPLLCSIFNHYYFVAVARVIKLEQAHEAIAQELRSRTCGHYDRDEGSVHCRCHYLDSSLALDEMTDRRGGDPSLSIELDLVHTTLMNL